MNRSLTFLLLATIPLSTACDDLLGGDGAQEPSCECDAAITKTAGSDFATGQTASYILNVSYNGHPDCDDGRLCIADTLPSGMTFAGYQQQAGDWSCSASGQDVSCCLDEPLATTLVDYTVEIEVQLDPAMEDTAENCASIDGNVKGAFSDADASNNESCVTVEIAAGQSDLSIVKSALSEVFEQGSTGTWQLDVTNNGPADAAGVTITDTLPEGMFFDSASSGWSCTDDGNNPQTVECVLSSNLAVGDTETLELTVIVEYLVDEDNCASVSADNIDPDRENNESCAAIPAPVELCDGEDNDGDGLIDEDFDLDGDGVARCCELEGEFFATRGVASQSLDLWYYESGTGTFATSPVEAADFGVGFSLMGVYDANNNGGLDILTARDNSIYLTTCDQEWQTQLVESTKVSYFGGADLDDDSELDMVGWEQSSGTGFTGLGGGGGSMSLQWSSYDMSSHISAYVLGRPYNLEDFNSDGFEDMVLWDYDSGSASSTDLFWMAGNGDGTFGPIQSLTTLSGQPQNYGDMGDLNEDGCMDIIGGGDDDGNSGAVYAFYGSCEKESITSTAVIADPCGSSSCTGNGWGPGYGMSQLHDWDGDGHLDLLTSHIVDSSSFYTAQIFFYVGDGTGSFSSVGTVVSTSDVSSYWFASPMNW